MKNYPETLYNLRIDKDLKQEDVAKFLQITKQAYGHYKKGKRQLPIEQLIKLCLFYGVSADYILGLPNDLLYPAR